MWAPTRGPRSPAAKRLAGAARSEGTTYRIEGRVWAGAPAQVQLGSSAEGRHRCKPRSPPGAEGRRSSRCGNCGQVGAAPMPPSRPGRRPRRRAVQGRWGTRRPAGSEAPGLLRPAGSPRPGSFHGGDLSDRRERIDRAGRSSLILRGRSRVIERPARYRSWGGSGRGLPPRFNRDRRPKADTDARGPEAPAVLRLRLPGLLRRHGHRREVRSGVSEPAPGRRGGSLALVLAGGGATAWISNVASVRLVPGTGVVASKPAARSEASQRRRVGGETSRAVSRSRYRKVSPEGDSSRRASSERRSPKGSRPRRWVQARQ